MDSDYAGSVAKAGAPAPQEDYVARREASSVCAEGASGGGTWEQNVDGLREIFRIDSDEWFEAFVEDWDGDGAHDGSCTVCVILRLMKQFTVCEKRLYLNIVV